MSCEAVPFALMANDTGSSIQMDRDRVAEWQQLMLDWESALARYTNAKRGELGAHDDETAESQAADEAFHRLLAIKRKIDDFVSGTRSLRDRERDHMVLGTLDSIQRRLDSIVSAANVAEASPANPEKSRSS